jgi:hypothetical protein
MRYLGAPALVLLSACSNNNGASLLLSTPLADGGTVAVGTPCVPTVEQSPTFEGFRQSEVWVETVAEQTSGAAVCLGYHFQGLVTCPYGQSADGGSPTGEGCETTDGQPVMGQVEPQCVNRRAASAVVWSCRCANANGQTDDGATYCDCPMSTTCAQAVVAVGPMPSALSGSYCVPTSAFGSEATCSAACDPTTHPCD